MTAVLLAALGCTAPSDDGPRVVVHTHTVSHTVNTSTTGTPTTAGDPCSVHQSGVICTLVGIPHQAGYAVGPLPADETLLFLPEDMGFDAADGRLYIADFNNHVIRRLEADGTVATVVGTGFIGDGTDPGVHFVEGPGTEFALHHPASVAFDPTDPDGVYIAAWENYRVDRYDIATGEVTYVAGVGFPSWFGDGGPATDAAFSVISSVSFGDDGFLYVVDQGNQLLRRIDALGTVLPYAGELGAYGNAGDGGPVDDAVIAALERPLASSQMVAHDGALWLADTGNQVIRRIDLSTQIITTVVGVYEPDPVGLDTDGDGKGDLFYGIGTYGGDGGPALAARLNSPRDLAFGPDGAMYIADTNNHCVRRVDPDGTIDTFAGQCGVPTAIDGDLLDGGDPSAATLFAPTGVEVDPQGNVYIADTNDQVIRVVWRRGRSSPHRLRYFTL